MWEQTSESTCVSCRERHMRPELFSPLHPTFCSSFLSLFLPHQYSHSVFLPREFLDAMTQFFFCLLSRKESRAYKEGRDRGGLGVKSTTKKKINEVINWERKWTRNKQINSEWRVRKIIKWERQTEIELGWLGWLHNGHQCGEPPVSMLAAPHLSCHSPQI